MSQTQDERGARLRALAIRKTQPKEEWQPVIATERVTDELKQAIDNLRAERDFNDQRAHAAARREDRIDQRYWQSRADGLSAGIAAIRDVLFHLVGEDG